MAAGRASPAQATLREARHRAGLAALHPQHPHYGWGTDFDTTTVYPGVAFLVGARQRSGKDYPHAHPTVLKYDTRELATKCGSISALFTSARMATIFSRLTFFIPMLWSMTLCFIIWASLHFAEASPISEGSVAALETFATAFAGLLSFPLSLFVSTTAKRWWDIRITCIGVLWASIDDLALWSSAWFKGPEGAEAHKLISRWGHASMSLLWYQARNENNPLDDLVDCELLTEREVNESIPVNQPTPKEAPPICETQIAPPVCVSGTGRRARWARIQVAGGLGVDDGAIL